jgi:hypothetical protein
MTVQELQPILDTLVAQATANTDAETAAANLIGKLGQIIVDNSSNPAVIEAIGTAMTNTTGALKSSADSLAAAIVAGTPVA